MKSRFMKGKVIMKKRSIFILLAVLTMLLAGCSAANRTNDYSLNNSFWGAQSQIGDKSGMYLSNLAANSENSPENGRYVIAQARIYLQTKQYENFSKNVTTKLKEMEGYIENKREENYDSGRLGSFTLRIPSEKLEEFTQWVEENATVISNEITKADVTDEFIETGSRKKSLEAEETALLAILEKAQTIDDIIKVQDRISNVRSELESYALKLQQLNNQVEYSTVYINAQEVDRITTPSQSFSSVAGSNFMVSVRNIEAGLRNFAIWFIGVSPYLIIFAIVLVSTVIIIKHKMKKRKSKESAST